MFSGKNWAWYAVTVVGASMSLYHLYVAFFGSPDAQLFRTTHLAFALVMAFLMSPCFPRKDGTPGWPDLLLVAASLLACGYQFWAKDYIDNRMIYVDDLVTGDWIFGLLMIAVLLEATRRLMGLVLPITALIFVSYGLFIHGTDLGPMLEQLFLTTDGILGIPVSVSATYVVLFILFGAFVERTGYPGAYGLS